MDQQIASMARSYSTFSEFSEFNHVAEIVTLGVPGFRLRPLQNAQVADGL